MLHKQLPPIDNLPPRIRKALEPLPSLSDEELREVALMFLSREEVPEVYEEGGFTDEVMWKKGYAMALMALSGKPVSKQDLEAAEERVDVTRGFA